MGCLKKRAGNFAPFIIGFLLVTLFLFSDCIFGDYKLSFTNFMYEKAPFDSLDVSTDGPWLSDVADSEYPSVYDTWYSGSISLWNNKIALGSAADTLANLLNPLKWVYFLPMGVAIFLKALTEFLIGFGAMYLYMRAIGLSKLPASVAGIVYTFSAVIVVWLGWPHSDVAVLAPLLFFAVEKLMHTIKVRYMLLLAVIVYLLLIVGMPTYAAYFMYLAGIYIVIGTFRQYWKRWRCVFAVGALFAVGVVLGALLSLPYTWSLLSTVGSNGYADSRTSYGTARLALEYLRTFLIPQIRDGLSMHSCESTLYVGLLPLMLLPLTLVHRKAKPRVTFFAVSSVVLLLLIFTDVFNFIYTKLPMVNTSLKYRVIALLMFSLSALAGITLNDLSASFAWYRARKWLMLVPVLTGGAVLFFLALYMAIEDMFLANLDTYTAIAKLILAVMVCLIVLMRRQMRVAQAAMLLLLVLAVYDGASFAKEYFPLIEKEADIIPEATDSVQYLMENTEEYERILGLGDWTLFPNTASYYGLNDIRTHNFVVTNPDIEEYYQAISSDAYASSTRISFDEIENYELLKYLGVKYVYGTDLDTAGEMASEELQVVYEGEDGLTIAQMSEYADKAELIETVLVYESDADVLDAMAVDYLENTIHVTADTGAEAYDLPLEEGESAELLAYSDDYVKIRCTTFYDRYVVLNDYYDSGWKAYINGEEVSIEKVNYLMRGVLVPAGEELIVEFRYEPADVYATLGCFAGTAVVMAALFLMSRQLQTCIDRRLPDAGGRFV